MDLIDSYVRSVRLFLPKDLRDDVSRELAEDLASQAADKQAELGRPLTDTEQADLLKQYGHPMVMAARYRSGRNLIGPVFFPIYLQVLKLILGIIVVTNVLSIAMLAVRGAAWSELGGGFSRLLDSALESVLFITLAAAFVEWSVARSKVFERWNPLSMKPADVHMRYAQRAVIHAGRQVFDTNALVQRGLDHAGPPLQARSIPELIVMAVVGSWLVAALVYPYMVLGSAASMIGWAPAVGRLFPVALVFLVVVLADQYLRLTRPTLAFVRFMRIAWANAAWMIILLVLIAKPEWVVWTGTSEQWARFGTLFLVSGRSWSLVDVVNAVITATILFAGLVTLIAPCRAKLRRLFGGAHTAHA